MRKIPQRSCIGCRTVQGKRDLLRIVRTPDGRLILDPTGKASGRGAYLCAARACLEAAVKRRAFDRSFRQAVPPEAVAALAEALRDRWPGLRQGEGAAKPESAGGERSD